MIAKLHTLHDGQAIKYDVLNLYLLLILLKAYNILAAQIEQTSQLGQRLEAKILDVRDVDVSIHYSQKRIPVVSPTCQFANDLFANVWSRFANV